MSTEFGLFEGPRMPTWEEDVDAHALRRQGWSISAIARHLGQITHGSGMPGAPCIRLTRTGADISAAAQRAKLACNSDGRLTCEKWA